MLERIAIVLNVTLVESILSEFLLFIECWLSTSFLLIFFEFSIFFSRMGNLIQVGLSGVISVSVIFSLSISAYIVLHASCSSFLESEN